ncbi:MAG: hypothetical protein ACK4GK_04525 [Ferrovibrio sp.]
MNSRFAGIFALPIVLAACMSSNVQHYGEIDATDKTITVPFGNSLLVGELKQRLRNDGWRMAVDRGPSVTQGRVGDSTRLESFDTFNTRYRLLVRASQYDYCINFSPAIAYDVSLIDNKTGEEIIAQSGRDCLNWAAEKFMDALKSKP